MDMVQPSAWEDALAAKAERPGLVPIAGGTDVMVDINFDRLRPEGLLDLGRVKGLGDWHVVDDVVSLGAGVTFAAVVADLGDLLPGLAMASKTVGSPQIRNRGTIGGNLGTASPAGDAHPPLLASGAVVVVESRRGTRRIPVHEFFMGPGRSALAPDELIRAVEVPIPRGPEQFAKVGTRNAMVVAVVSLALALDEEGRRVGTGIGSAGPTPFRALAAEAFLADRLPRDSADEVPEEVVRRFGDLVAAAATPIDDVRGTAAYRRHALGVLAARTLRWAWQDRRSRVST